MINETNLTKLAFVLAANGGGSGSGSSSGGGGVMVISSTYDEQTSIITLGKTWQEIYDALREGVLCITQDDVLDGISLASVGLITSAGITPDGHYYVFAIYNGAAGISSTEYHADVADGYPSAED